MKTKFLLAFTVIAPFSVALCIAEPDKKIKLRTPELPPLPPGLVMGEDGKIKEVPVARLNRKNLPKKQTEIAENPAPGSRIDEPAGAALPEKKAAGDENPK